MSSSPGIEAPDPVPAEQLALPGTDAPAPGGPAADAPPGDEPGAGGPAPPTDEQLAAIETRDRDVFCEAGAGTGKTRVLADRYCEAVASDGVGPESILAFTFTERAAGELRARIRAELGWRADAARAAGDAARAAELAGAARDSERAWITTIHGFCHRLLAAHPVAAGIDPRFRVLDETEALRLRLAARDAAIAEVLEAGDRELLEAAAAYQPWRVGDMAIAAHERLRSQGVVSPTLPAVGDPVRSRRNGDDEVEALSPAERAAAERARALLAAVLAAFGERYEELKAARAGLDFADLELRALELLRSSPAVAAAWRERFAHVMVDEFQDTNRVQIELIEALRGPETRLFCVGDEAQSIYRFRNAELAVFRAERDRAQADERTAIRPLTGSFRSRPGVLAAVNALGGALIGPGFRPLAGCREEGDPASPRAELHLVARDGDDGGWDEQAEALEPPPGASAPAVVAEARVVAARLRELVDSGEAAPGEIAVLLRAFTHVDAYEEALERAGLDPYVVGGRGYWSQQQVEDVIRILAAIANPLDDEMLLGALAGPAGVSPDALWLLRRASSPGGGEPPHLWPLIERAYGGGEGELLEGSDEWLDAVPRADAERLERFCARLARLRAAAPVLALDELVERALRELGYDLALLARPGGRGRMANVRKLIRLAREFEAHEGRDLRGFLDAAEDLTARNEREGMAATQAEDHDGVRIMTVHAAKGLEFPVVAVPDLGRGLAQGERSPDVVVGPLEGTDGDSGPRARFGLRLALPDADSVGVWELHELDAESRAAAAEEGCRLVHVAATRARERLILSGCFAGRDTRPADPSPGDSPLRRLLGALADRGLDPDAEGGRVELDPPPAIGERATLESPPELLVRVVRPAPEAAAELARRRPRAAAVTPELVRGRPPLARPPRAEPVGHLSYSALAEYERCAYRFHLERMVGLPPTALTRAAEPEGERPASGARERRLAIGNAVHAALDWSARRGWREPGAGEIAALAGRERIEDDDREALDEIRELVSAWLGSELCRGLAGRPARSEVPFAIELGGTIVRGQIDLLVPGREPVVVDYKTDDLGDSRPAELAERYRAQRELYALAVAAALGDDGGPIRAVHCFLAAASEPVETTFDRAGLEAARSRLRSVVEAIRGGGFEPTPEPSWQVCVGCPAAARLCPHPAWRPPAGAREPD